MYVTNLAARPLTMSFRWAGAAPRYFDMTDLAEVPDPHRYSTRH